MANNTPHVVGGGIGTFRKEGVKAGEAKKKAEAMKKFKESLRK